MKRGPMNPQDAAFVRKYGSRAFDADKRGDAVAEAARQAMISAFLIQAGDMGGVSGEDVRFIASGLMVGLACVIAAHVPKTDQSHAQIRSSLLQLSPWAVDMMRSIDGMGPLSDA